MTLLEIEAFLAIIQHGTMSAAAKALYITQPALTRRIQKMEQELGYPLIVRQKGHRAVRLTEQGAEFYRIAWKWQDLFEETNGISRMLQNECLSLAAVSSVSQHILVHILPDLLEKKIRLRLYNAFSKDAFQHVVQGLYDLAFVERQEPVASVPVDVCTRPAFAESFVIASRKELPQTSEGIDWGALHPEKELYIPWNQELKIWHAEQFREKLPPAIILEDLSLLDDFLQGDRWAIVPYTMCTRLAVNGVHVYAIPKDAPKRIIYYQCLGHAKKPAIKLVLSLLDKYLRTLPAASIQSLL